MYSFDRNVPFVPYHAMAGSSYMPNKQKNESSWDGWGDGDNLEKNVYESETQPPLEKTVQKQNNGHPAATDHLTNAARDVNLRQLWVYEGKTMSQNLINSSNHALRKHNNKYLTNQRKKKNTNWYSRVADYLFEPQVQDQGNGPSHFTSTGGSLVFPRSPPEVLQRLTQRATGAERVRETPYGQFEVSGGMVQQSHAKLLQSDYNDKRRELRLSGAAVSNDNYCMYGESGGKYHLETPVVCCNPTVSSPSTTNSSHKACLNRDFMDIKEHLESHQENNNNNNNNNNSHEFCGRIEEKKNTEGSSCTDTQFIFEGVSASAANSLPGLEGTYSPPTSEDGDTLNQYVAAPVKQQQGNKWNFVDPKIRMSLQQSCASNEGGYKLWVLCIIVTVIIVLIIGVICWWFWPKEKNVNSIITSPPSSILTAAAKTPTPLPISSPEIIVPPTTALIEPEVTTAAVSAAVKGETAGTLQGGNGILSSLQQQLDRLMSEIDTTNK